MLLMQVKQESEVVKAAQKNEKSGLNLENKLVRMEPNGKNLKVTVFGLTKDEVAKLDTIKNVWGLRSWGMSVDKVETHDFGPGVLGLYAVSFEVKGETSLGTVVPKKK